MMTHTSFSKSITPLIVLAILLSSLLLACSKEEANITLTPSDVSGSIFIRGGTQVDNDTNDPNSSRISNNSPAEAQNLPNPVLLGGYVAAPQSGVAGPLFISGDPDDYFSVYLQVGDSVNLNPYSGDMTLSISEPNNGAFNPVSGNQFNAVNEGTHIINIHANSGASEYTLNVTAPATAAALNVSAQADFVPGEIIVTYKDAAQARQSRSLQNQILSNTANLGFKVRAGHPSRSMLLSIADASNRSAVRSNLNISGKAGTSLKQETLDVIAALKQQPDIADARPNYIYQAFAVPVDPGYKYMWDYQMMKMEAAWEISKGVGPVIVAVLDTGILSQHEDFVDSNGNSKLVPGYDFISSSTRARDGDGIDDNPEDPGDNPPTSSFHGTHVSGTVGAATDNGVGIPAVGWNIKVMPLRVLGNGGGTEYDIEQAILYAIGEPNDSGTVPAQAAQVINMSLGGPASNLTLPPAFQKAFAKNVFIVAAAGNETNTTPVPYSVFPAGLPGVISVGAVGSDEKVAAYSNYGSFLSLVAPGGDATGADRNNDGYADGIISTLGSDATGSIQLGYGIEIGTSMASPHVAAVIALMKTIYPDMTPQEFRTWLADGQLTDDLPPLGRDDKSGYGLLNAEKALNVAKSAANIPNTAAKLALNPISLDFGDKINTLSFSVSNDGSDPLTITAVNADQSWVSVAPLSVDNNGLGTYQVSVDRSGLATVQYRGNITVVSSVETKTIAYSFTQPQLDNAGQQYVRLSNGSQTYTVKASYINGQYSFAFKGIAPGEYQLSSFSNLDNNDATDCNSGEACGTYIATAGNSSNIVVKTAQPVSGVKFYTGFNSVNSGSPLGFAPSFFSSLN